MRIFEPITLSGLVVLAVVLSSSAYAGSCGGASHSHSAQEMAEQYFSMMDANGDELVSEAEFKSSEMTRYVKSFEALKPNTQGLVEKGSFVRMFVEAHEKKPEV